MSSSTSTPETAPSCIPSPDVPNSRIVEIFFTKGETVGNIISYKCRCDAVVSVRSGKGYTNLLNHVKSNKHKDWEEIVAQEMQDAEKTLGVVKKPPILQHKAKTIFAWIEWITQSNLPLSFCEDAFTRKYSNLPSISSKTLVKYIENTSLLLIQNIKSLLPHRFPIIFDGWEDGSSRYYVAAYTYIIQDDIVKYILLGLQQPKMVGSFDACAHTDLLSSIMQEYDKTLESISFLIGDNCNLNKAIANNLGIPLVGCASRRLNLACKMRIAECEDLLKKVNNLMTKLKTKKRMSKLRGITTLTPMTRMTVRWAADYAMITRFFEILQYIEHIAPRDPELMDSLLKEQEVEKLGKLLEVLEEFNAVSLCLQKEPSPHLSLVRELFDALIEKYPDTCIKIGKDVAIINNPTFENAIVNSINMDVLNEEEEHKIAMFHIEEEVEVIENNLSIPEKALLRNAKRQRKMKRYDVQVMKHIPSTSNLVERLFSKVNHIFTFDRKAMDPNTLENILFLKENSNFWNVATVNQVCVSRSNEV